MSRGGHVCKVEGSQREKSSFKRVPLADATTGGFQQGIRMRQRGVKVTALEFRFQRHFSGTASQQHRFLMLQLRRGNTILEQECPSASHQTTELAPEEPHLFSGQAGI